MPKFKLSGAKAVEQKSGFEPYDGPEPTRRGMYRGIIKVMKWGLNKNSGSSGFNITLELEAAKGDPKGHAIFDGFPMFSRNIITESANGAALKEGAQRNLNNLLAALGVKDEPEVILEDGDEDKVNVKKIGGKNPIGQVVNIDIDFELYEGERRPQVGGIYPYKEIAGAGKADRAAVLDEDEDDEADLMEDGDEPDTDEDEGDDEFAARQEELEGLGIPALKKIAKELEIGISGTKAALIERILDAEFADDEDADEESDEDETEDDAEEAEDEDEAEDDEEEEDDEDEEDEDDEARAEREAELADLDRIALKRILKEVNKDFTVLKKTTDDELREAILAAEFGSGDLPF